MWRIWARERRLSSRRRSPGLDSRILYDRALSSPSRSGPAPCRPERERGKDWEDPRLTTQAVYYRDASGHEPVDAWIDALPAKVALKADDTIDLLNGLPDEAPPLAFPFSSQIDGPLREMRYHYGRRLIRILYQRSSNLFVLLHAIDKAGRAVPERDVEVAKQRMADFQARMDARPRVPPRAAGRDAPSALRRRPPEGRLA